MSNNPPESGSPENPDRIAHASNENRLLHDLGVHQAELAAQNETLRQTQIALEESREVFVDLYDFAPVGYLTLSVDGRIKAINLTGAGLLGADRLDLIERRFADFIAPADQDRWLRHFLDLFVHGGKRSYELHLVGCGGKDFAAGLDCLLVRSGQAQPSLRLAISDISERKKSEASLKEAHRLLDDVQKLLKIGGWSYLPATGRVTWTEQVYRIFGVGPDFDTDDIERIFDFYLPDDREQIARAFEQSVHAGQPYDLEARLARADGALIWVRTWGVPQFEDGKLTRITGTISDITERKLAEQELERHRHHLEELVSLRTAELEAAKRVAEAANCAKSAFLANMSHEIRTPMTAIIGMGDLIRLDPLTPKQTERLDKMNVAAQHLLGIISNVLDLSKIEAGKLVLDEIELDIGELLGNVAAMVADRASAKGLKITVEHCNISGTVLGDPVRIRQALLNYVGNAVKFTERGTIAIRAALHEDRGERALLRFEVQDHGIGVPAEAIGRLFSNFEQADNSMTRLYGGTGLGLAIVRQIALLMNGTTGVDSIQGVGSTFWFTAELKKTPGSRLAASAPAPAEGAAPLRPERKRRALVVDDEPVNRDVIEAMLETIGFDVDHATHGGEAVERAAATSYALILTDLHMPLMDGIEATRRIRRLPINAGVPILAVTGNVTSSVADQCMQAGMNDFLAKPFQMHQLLAVVNRWVADQGPPH